jgi:hypothetical protein
MKQIEVCFRGKILDCFAKPVIGRRSAPTHWLAITEGLQSQQALFYVRWPC